MSPAAFWTRLVAFFSGTHGIYTVAALFVLGSLIITTTALQHHTDQRIRELEQFENARIKLAVNQVQARLEQQLDTTRQVLRAFLQHEKARLDQWAAAPANGILRDQLAARLVNYLPNLFSLQWIEPTQREPFPAAPADWMPRMDTARSLIQWQTVWELDETRHVLRLEFDAHGLIERLQPNVLDWRETPFRILLLRQSPPGFIVAAPAGEEGSYKLLAGQRLTFEESRRLSHAREVNGSPWVVAALTPPAQSKFPRWSMWREVLSVVVPLLITSLFLLSFIRRESQRRAAIETGMRGRQEQLRMLIDHVPFAVFMKDGHGRWLEANESALRMFHLQTHQVDQYLGHTDEEIAHKASGPYRQSLINCKATDEEAWRLGESYRYEQRFDLTRNEERIYDVIKIPRFHPDQSRQLLVMVAADITARKHYEQALYAEKERGFVILSAITNAVISTDAEGCIEYMNPLAEKMTGHYLNKVRGVKVETIAPLHDENTSALLTPHPVYACLDQLKVVLGEGHTTMPKDADIWLAVEETAAPLRDPLGSVTGAVLILHDVTEPRRLSRELAYRASHDALTGLMNRDEFEKRVKSALRESGGRQAVFCYLDLDQFKLVNDTCGHVAGDNLLSHLARMLAQNLSANHTLARLGGDEFGILLENTTLEQARELAEQLREEIRNYRFMWQNRIFNIGVSIGVVDVQHVGQDFTAILSAADSACYAAKDRGRNRIHIFHPEDSNLTTRQSEMEWVSRIHNTFEQKRFHLFRQRIAPLRPDLPQGDHFEVLIRMRDEQDRWLAPSSFLSAAERYNLMPTFDRWVVRTMFDYFQRTPQELADLACCSINLSGQSLSDELFLDFMNEMFDTYEIPPEKICLEITESVAVTKMGDALHLIHNLRDRGCEFALDDFGTGFSSFSYLKNLPVDYLKIDGSFVKDILDNPIDYAMTDAINQIGHVMGLKTVAEYAENESVVERLRSLGVDYGQGYGIEKPRPLV